MRNALVVVLVASAFLVSACGKSEMEKKEEAKKEAIDKVFGSLKATKVKKNDQKE